jgi:hypothetical protein
VAGEGVDSEGVAAVVLASGADRDETSFGATLDGVAPVAAAVGVDLAFLLGARVEAGFEAGSACVWGGSTLVVVSDLPAAALVLLALAETSGLAGALVDALAEVEAADAVVAAVAPETLTGLVCLVPLSCLTATTSGLGETG